MKKATKIWLAAAACLVALGTAISAAALAACNWDLSKLSTPQYETNTHELSGEFESISIDTSVADVSFVLSEEGKVVCYETQSAKHTVTVEDGVLAIKEVDESEWYDHIGIFTDAPTVTLYLPLSEYTALTVQEHTGDVILPNNFTFESIDILTDTGDVQNGACAKGTIRVETDTGDVTMEKVSAGALEIFTATGDVNLSDMSVQGDAEIRVSTGRVEMRDMQCKNLISNGETGDMRLENTVAAETFSIERDTGDVEFVSCDAAEISVVTDTGDITGNLREDKFFLAQSDTGDVEVPASFGAGKCELTSDTGDIRIVIG